MLGGSVVIFHSKTRALVLCIKHQLYIIAIIPHGDLFKYFYIYTKTIKIIKISFVLYLRVINSKRSVKID